MARQCCRDSAAWWVRVHGEQEADLVPCRWGCEGYARFENGKWHYAEDEPADRRLATKADFHSPGVQVWGQARRQERALVRMQNIPPLACRAAWCA